MNCPKCRQRHLKEKYISGMNLSVDVCPQCRGIWFDGGELAQWQLYQESRPQAREAGELQRRAMDRTVEETRELEHRIDRAPLGSSAIRELRPWIVLIALAVAIAYVLLHPEMPRAQSWAIGLGIIAIFFMASFTGFFECRIMRSTID